MEEKKLALIYIKKINKLMGLNINKECIVRKKPHQYAYKNISGIRYLIFEDKDLQKSNENYYTIVGKKIEGGKFKNYFLGEVSLEEANKITNTKDKLCPEDMIKVIDHLVNKKDNHKEEFYDYLKSQYAISY
jgi:hypothetical protein